MLGRNLGKKEKSPLSKGGRGVVSKEIRGKKVIRNA
jgi:hypothetical protein